MTHYAIIGGAGFIGSHMVDFLARQKHDVTVIDNLTAGTRAHLAAHLHKPYFNLIVDSAENTDAIQFHLRGVDTVVHLASNPDIARAIKEPRIDFDQGTRLTESVLEACRIAGVKNVIYASGSGVYRSDTKHPLDEDSQIQPISTYGASKLAGESLLAAYSYMFGIRGLVFRFANVVGPRQTHGVGFDFINRLHKNPKELIVLGNGYQNKSYIDVEDVISGVFEAHKKVINSFDVYNIATQDSLRVRDIVQLTLEIMNLDSSTKVIYGETDYGWRGDIPQILLNSDKLRRLGWQNLLNSREAMEKALKSMYSRKFGE